MSNQAVGTASAGSHSSRPVEEVIKMFAEFGLLVCDDGDVIKQKFEEKRPYYVNMMGKPDPAMQAKGKEGTKSGEALLNRRSELLRIVYDHFTGLADTTLVSMLDQGQSTLSEELVAQLRSILALKACRVDETLADQFVADYLRERGLKIGKVLTQPAVVENFTATGEVGCIKLNWTLPKVNCDEIEIVREADLPDGQRQVVTVYHGRGKATFPDADVQAGMNYTYRAHAIFRKLRGTDTVAHAVCLAEVSDAGATWQDGYIHLQWRLPAAEASVVIFRREGGAPRLRQGQDGPEPTDALTQSVYTGRRAVWDDTQVTEGATYHYRIIAIFGQSYSAGVAVQATVPQPPPMVTGVTATYRCEANNRDVVVVEWEPVPSNLVVEYIVVRNEGNTPATHIDDGRKLVATDHIRHVDEQVEVGARYTYMVFTRQGDLYSRDGAAAPAVDILAEVSELTAQIGNGTVELIWETPPNISQVLVRRSVNPPRSHTDGTAVKLTGTGHAKDEGLHNGRRYHYLVCCVYRPDGVTEVVSPGARISATPEQLPEAVTDFYVEVQGREVVCTWTKPVSGEAVVVRSGKVSDWQSGQRLMADEVNNIHGERLVTEDNCRALDGQPNPNQPYYTIFTIAGPHAIAGEAFSAVICQDVTGLMLAASQDGVILRWAWPGDECHTVKVVRRTDAWPEGADDPRATCTYHTRKDYQSSGEKILDKISTPGLYHYIVYAQALSTAGQFYAPGLDPGCRAEIQWERWMTLRYRLWPAMPGGNKRLLAGKDKNLRLTWSIEESFTNFSGFALIANEDHVPENIDDGVEVFRWTPPPGRANGAHEAWVNLEPVQRKNWAFFNCKAFVIEPAQRYSTLIIHPDVCQLISATGEGEVRQVGGAARHYRAGVPEKIICPYCLDEFPVEQLFFDSQNGGEATRVNYTTADRLRRRPLQPPRNKQGQLLTRKYCPTCLQQQKFENVLPFTAGLQESLVIGLIGAKYSGKSHYIAALIERLEGRVGADMQAALISATNTTPRRYRTEFYEPLFGKKEELPLTMGTPSPLIYDLTLDGKLWGEKEKRAVTLAFYDTAGENLQDPDTAQRMVSYLRIASGVIFLVDPLQIPAVNEALPNSMLDPTLPRDEAPQQIIANVLQLLEDGKVIASTEKLSIPMAVVFAKCDVLRDAGLIDLNRLWNTDKRHRGYYDTTMHEDLSGMMGEYFQRWSLPTYNNIRQRFSCYAFFGASSTGCAADQSTRHYKFISPWRAEDPLLWLLAEVGVIPTR